MLQPLFPTLPVELNLQILSYLSKDDLLQLRFICQRLNSSVTPEIFSTIQLKGDSPSPEHFVNIALSPTLREHVREVYCDPYLEGSYDDDVMPEDTRPIHFLQALDYLRYCRNLKSLQIHFHEVYYGEEWPHQSKGLRLYILNAIFESLAGTWSHYKPAKLRRDWNNGKKLPFKFAHNTSEQMEPICLSNLSINSLLAHRYGQFQKGTDLDLFKAITSLNLHITTMVTLFDKLPMYKKPDRYYFYNELLVTWLSPSMTTNLRELSLTALDWWGWIPRLDLRAIGGSKGLPSLKVLTLGKFVFSHQEQIKWLPSLELEELYLKGCAILHEARGPPLLDKGLMILGQDAEGNDLIMSKDGYPTPQWWNHSFKYDEFETVSFSMWWYEMLGQWCGSMTTLKRLEVTGGEVRTFPYIVWHCGGGGGEWYEAGVMEEDEFLDEDTEYSDDEKPMFWIKVREKDHAMFERLGSLNPSLDLSLNCLPHENPIPNRFCRCGFEDSPSSEFSES